jgi:hypothetical protein
MKCEGMQQANTKILIRLTAICVIAALLGVRITRTGFGAFGYWLVGIMMVPIAIGLLSKQQTTLSSLAFNLVFTSTPLLWTSLNTPRDGLYFPIDHESLIVIVFALTIAAAASLLAVPVAYLRGISTRARREK